LWGDRSRLCSGFHLDRRNLPYAGLFVQHGAVEGENELQRITGRFGLEFVAAANVAEVSDTQLESPLEPLALPADEECPNDNSDNDDDYGDDPSPSTPNRSGAGRVMTLEQHLGY
jgi:hypothetical protein